MIGGLGDVQQNQFALSIVEDVGVEEARLLVGGRVNRDRSVAISATCWSLLVLWTGDGNKLPCVGLVRSISERFAFPWSRWVAWFSVFIFLFPLCLFFGRGEGWVHVKRYRGRGHRSWKRCLLHASSPLMIVTWCRDNPDGCVVDHGLCQSSVCDCPLSFFVWACLDFLWVSLSCYLERECLCYDDILWLLCFLWVTVPVLAFFVASFFGVAVSL